jgi:hypothetical protein
MKYFFVKNKINHGEVAVKHCPTKQMWIDINTKSKQGLVFRVFQGRVMSIPVDYKDADYFGNVPTFPPVVILSLSKEQLASKGCFEEQMNGHILTSARPNGLTESEGIDDETCLDAGMQAPIKVVNDRPCSPGIYWCRSQNVAWERASI